MKAFLLLSLLLLSGAVSVHGLDSTEGSTEDSIGQDSYEAKAESYVTEFENKANIQGRGKVLIRAKRTDKNPFVFINDPNATQNREHHLRKPHRNRFSGDY